MNSQEKALTNPMDLQAFDYYIQDICRCIKVDPQWPDLSDHLRVVRGLLNTAFTQGSVYSHSAWVNALTPLTSLEASHRSDQVVLAIAEHLGTTHDYNRLVLPSLSPAGRERLAEILASDPRQSIILPFLHTLGKFAACCQGAEASFATLFGKFLALSKDGKFRNQQVSTRHEHCIAALKALNNHLSHCPDNPHTHNLLQRKQRCLQQLINLPCDMVGGKHGWIGLDLFVTLHKLGIGSIVPAHLRPENTGNPYNAMHRLASIGKAPAPTYFNDKLVSVPGNLTLEHLCYAIQNPELVLPLDHLVRSAIAFDVLTGWIKKINTMELPEPHGPQRLVEVLRTLVTHKPRLVSHILAADIRLEGLMEIETLREAYLQRDIGL
ncbi:hypothetical protein [Pseudomonas sp. S1(2024)]|uniref:hypothetical protein n=1 Tax=Pseudomonas sp. S1(2024) TaxID=3390191 RepID=UPI00397C047A